MFVGLGYDVHRFAKGRKLFLGGVEIPHVKGLLGHSDADVVIHALMDALLGAAGLPDIGHFFPPSDPAYKNISSLLLLKEVMAAVAKKRFSVVNVDISVLAEQPKLAPHMPAMKEALAAVMKIPASRVGLKATTNEKLGFVGRGEGIAAFAVASLNPKRKR
jgi:2-C-methyl-D-erythritol 2,4-cyclodiphosphate synthase